MVEDDNHLVLLVDVELLLLLDLAEAVRIAIFLEEVALVLVSLHFLLHLLNDVLADGFLVVAAALEQVPQLDLLAAGLAAEFCICWQILIAASASWIGVRGGFDDETGRAAFLVRTWHAGW